MPVHKSGTSRSLRTREPEVRFTVTAKAPLEHAKGTPPAHRRRPIRKSLDNLYEQALRSNPLHLPRIPSQPEPQPVMHPIPPSLPELDLLRPNPPPTPMRRHRNPLRVSELPLDLVQRGLQSGPPTHYSRLRRSPSPDLRPTRPRVPVLSGLHGPDLLHDPTHMRL